MDRCQQIERSISKKYRKPIWNRFVGGIKDYGMINAGDKIAVCISGGKDSMLLAKCLQMLQKYSDVPFELVFLAMDPGYREENARKVAENAALLQIPLTSFSTRIFEVVGESAKSPCYLCARMRRGCLYNRAQELGCNKIALGHHFDDVIETTLMSMLYGAEMRTMMPKLHSAHYHGMELIRPLYLVHEADIIAWARYNELSFIRCACRVSEQNEAAGTEGSKRQVVKKLIAQLRRENSNVDSNIFHSAECVNLETVLGWRDSNGEHSFLDDYDQYYENNQADSGEAED